MPRPLSAPERALLEFLLTREFAGVTELRRQASDVRTDGATCDCGCASFSLHPDRTKAPAPVFDRVPTEAHGTDPLGTQVGVLLFVDAGYLAEVEVYGRDGNPTGGLPVPTSLKLSEWTAADASGARHLRNP